MTKRFFKAIWLIAFLFVAAVFAAGQARTGEIRIEVKDPTGSGMQASGKLTEVATNFDRAFETDATGSYSFSILRFGRYRLELSRDGFSTQSTLIDVQSESPISRTITMSIGATAYSVDVVST